MMNLSNNITKKITSRFFNSILDEVKSSNAIYSPKIAKMLNMYYPYFRDNKIIDHGYDAFYYTTRTSYFLNHLKKGDKILDVGCGTGSEAILFALCGGIVDAIDLSKDRLETARQRKAYYEKKHKTSLNINLEMKNVLKHEGTYDLIWVNEAISHIAPISEFIEMCHKNLISGGKLIISDANNLNPIIFMRNKSAQKDWGAIYRKEKHPITGETYIYAMERCFTIPAIKKILSTKFKINAVYPVGYFPPFVFNRFKKSCVLLEKIVRTLPLVRLLSGVYVIVCSKH
ncbi:MAG: class I SAM-dependent methyltransferase [Promethearchaeota archaeon]